MTLETLSPRQRGNIEGYVMARAESVCESQITELHADVKIQVWLSDNGLGGLDILDFARGLLADYLYQPTEAAA